MITNQSEYEEAIEAYWKLDGSQDPAAKAKMEYLYKQIWLYEEGFNVVSEDEEEEENS